MPSGGIVDPGVGGTLGPWLWAAAVALLTLAAVIGAVEGGRPGGPRVSKGLAAIGAVAIAVLGVTLVLSGAPMSARFGHVLGFSTVDVHYDELSGVFLVALGIVGFAASVAALDG